MVQKLFLFHYIHSESESFGRIEICDSFVMQNGLSSFPERKNKAAPIKLLFIVREVLSTHFLFFEMGRKIQWCAILLHHFLHRNRFSKMVWNTSTEKFPNKTNHSYQTNGIHTKRNTIDRSTRVSR